jgi:putative cardiolipin synthase
MPTRNTSSRFAPLLLTALACIGSVPGAARSPAPFSSDLVSATGESTKDPAALLEAELVKDWHAAVDGILRRDSGKSSAFVMDKGEHALRIRGWLGLNAKQNIDVQYFIWSTDNVGRLALAGLLQAANRGVHVRILVDDLMLEKPYELLLAMDAHPKVEIRVYNANNTLGVGLWKRIWTALTNFRNLNQRMHQKTFIVDNRAAVVGGRNMADEYYDFDPEFNFRDRDVLLAGPAVEQIRDGFTEHWNSPLSVPVSSILVKEAATLPSSAVDSIGRDLLARWDDTTHFSPQMKQGILDVPRRVPDLLHDMDLCDAKYIRDAPGKNDGTQGLGGGGVVTSALAALLDSAQHEVLIQSPYLVLDPKALALFASLVKRGVKVRISTNSAANSDNHYAVSGYQKQRDKILAAGIEVHELKPHPQNRTRILQRYAQFGEHPPIIVLHAKTAVIDRRILVVGTYNLDPRSQNLNTEAAVVMPSLKLAKEAADAIEQDMLPENSWNASSGEGDRSLSFWQRLKLWLWSLIPMDPIL